MREGNIKALIVIVIQTVTAQFFCSTSVHAIPFLSWDGGSGHTWPGWIWSTDASGWGEKGWNKDNGVVIYGIKYPRSHEKTDYGNRSDADIGNFLPPYKSRGNTVKIYNISGDKTAAWWWIYDKNFGQYGYADGATNRLEFYAYYQNLDDFVNTSTSDISNWSLHFGTYLCWPGGGIGGEDCPKEASNQHWYHHITAHNGAWIKHQINRHPDHQRGASPPINPTDDPASPHHYFQYMNAFYFETETMSTNPLFWVDDIVFRTETQPENEVSISHIWV